VALAPAAAEASPLFQAIAPRHSARGEFDGLPLARDDLAPLQAAGSSDGVRWWLLTDRPAMERPLEYIEQGNTAQLADAAFVSELTSWIRFNPSDAVRTRDGLFSLSSGNPPIPTWLGERAFGWSAVDEQSAKATFTDGPITLTLLFRFNEAGLIGSFRAEARGGTVGKQMVMAPWEGIWSNYQLRDGVPVPFTGKVAWMRPEGRRPYFVGTVTALAFEFAP